METTYNVGDIVYHGNNRLKYKIISISETTVRAIRIYEIANEDDYVHTFFLSQIRKTPYRFNIGDTVFHYQTRYEIIDNSNETYYRARRVVYDNPDDEVFFEYELELYEFSCGEPSDDNYDDNDDDNDNEDTHEDPPYIEYKKSGTLLRNKENKNTTILQSQRGFGVEIECIAEKYSDYGYIADQLKEGIGMSGDGSLGDRGFELQLPVLNGKNGEEIVTDTCKMLKNNGCYVTNDCGYHLHIKKGINENKFEFIQKLMFILYIFDPVIMSFVPKNRRVNHYCQRLSKYIRLNDIMEAKNLDDLEMIWYNTSNQFEIVDRKQTKYDNSRYYGFNFHSYFSNGHLEIRHHSGTINPEKILHWVNLHTLLIDAVKKIKGDLKSWKRLQEFLSTYDNDFNDESIDKGTKLLFDFIELNDKSKDYFLARQKKFYYENETDN